MVIMRCNAAEDVHTVFIKEDIWKYEKYSFNITRLSTFVGTNTTTTKTPTSL